jgi:hypothetical protein
MCQVCLTDVRRSVSDNGGIVREARTTLHPLITVVYSCTVVYSILTVLIITITITTHTTSHTSKFCSPKPQPP